MSRLYIEHYTDRGKGSGHMGNERQSAKLLWGSVGDSKIAVSASIEWYKGDEYPNVYVILGSKSIPKENIHVSGLC